MTQSKRTTDHEPLPPSASARKSPVGCIVTIVLGIIGLVGLIVWRQANPPQGIGFRADPQRSGVYRSSAKSEWWNVDIGAPSVSAPVVVGDTLYIGATTPSLFAIDIGTGTVKWKFKAQDDIPFSPVVDGDKLFVACVSGVVFAVDTRTGREIWRFRTERFNQIATSPIVVGNLLYFGAYDNALYAVDKKTGKSVWRAGTDGYVESSPLYADGRIYFGTYGGSVYAVSSSSGKTLWRQKTGNKIIAAPSLAGNAIVIGSRDSSIYAFDRSTGKILWKKQVDGPIDATAAVNGNDVVVGSQKILYSLDAKTGKKHWEIPVNMSPYASTAIDGNTVYVPSLDKGLRAVDQKLGIVKWTYSTPSRIEDPPSVAGDSVFFVTSDGYLHAVDKKTGASSAHLSISVSQLYKNLSAFDVAEFVISFDDSHYVNPETDLNINARFTNTKNGKKYEVHGFYYDKNEWRVRFAPPEAGTWDWTIDAKASPTDHLHQNGKFEVVDAQRSGFLKINPSDDYSLIDSRGNAFHPIGISDTLADTNNDNDPFDNMYADEKLVNLDSYLRIYGPMGAGFNLFRWGVDNVSFPLMNPAGFLKSEPPLIREGIWADELAMKIHRNGMKSMMQIFGFNPPFSKEETLTDEQRKLIRNYVSYIIARYGAYVDIWELANESEVSQVWLDTVMSEIKNEDPYHHLTSISWEFPAAYDPRLDIVAPHWYENEPETESDVRTIEEIEKRKWDKPIIFGEQGNKTVNWDARSAVRMRIRLWTATMNGAGMVLWNTSSTKNYRSSYNTSNIYIGPDERMSVRALSSFVNHLNNDLLPEYTAEYGMGVRVYRMNSKTQTAGYIHRYVDHETMAPASISINAPQGGKVIWFDPATGKTVGETEMTAGTQQVTTPAFLIDLSFFTENI